jgi:transposase
MTDRSRTYISSVMTAKESGASPDKRRKYGEAFKAEALRLAIESRSTQAAAWQLGCTR